MQIETPASSPVAAGLRRVEDHLTGRGWVPYVLPLGESDLLGPVLEPAVPDAGVVVPVHVAGRTAVVGPVGPGTSPCHRCLGRRWQLLRSEEERDVLERGAVPRTVGENPWLTPFALDALRHLAELVATAGDDDRARPDLPWVHELRLDTLRVRRHPLTPDPDCPLCGTARPEEPRALEPVSRPKTGVDDYRLRPLHDFPLPLAAYANPVCGALGSAALPAFDSTTTAPVTGYTRVRGVWMLHEFFWSGHADTFDDSALLGVLEGLERHAGLQPRGRGEPVRAAYRDLVPHALDPRDCGVYPDAFYAATAPYHQPFTEDLELPWVWAYSLRDAKPVLVPERLVYYLSRRPGANFVEECSNGCAIGSCWEEAVLHGMLELIERDAFLLAWYGRARLPEIDPASCRRRETRLMVERLRLIGYDVRLFDNRIDFPVPVVTGVAVRSDGGLGTLCFAAGAGLDPEDAVRAALCEIASYVPSFDQRMRDNLDEVRAMAADFRMVTELKHHALLYGLPEMAHHADFLLADPDPRPMDEVYGAWERERPRNLDLLDDLRYVQGLLTGAGFDVIAADQTSPEQLAPGLRTACVIVPGLIPIDFGWHKQRAPHLPRLRTAFRRAGMRATDLADADINPMPHPFP